MIAWAIFHNPMRFAKHDELWLLIPLCLSVAIVYKTIRTSNIRRLPLEILGLVAYMFAGLGLVGTVLWLVTEYWV